MELNSSCPVVEKLLQPVKKSVYILLTAEIPKHRFNCGDRAGANLARSTEKNTIFGATLEVWLTHSSQMKAS
jgi:hypothetical protein